MSRPHKEQRSCTSLGNCNPSDKMTSLSGLLTRATVADKPVEGEMMLATAWQGKQRIEIVTVPRPAVTEPVSVTLGPDVAGSVKKNGG